MKQRAWQLARGVEQRFDRHELLLRASAIAFQVLTAVVPFALFLTGMAGFLGLEGIYEDELAPTLQERVSTTAFTLLDDTVRDVLGGRQGFWATAGLALAIWQLSGAVRTVGASLNDIYGHEEERPWVERMVGSLWVAAAVEACLAGALLVTAVAPLLYGDVPLPLDVLFFLLRYGIAVGLLILAIGLVVHHAPAERRPVRWVTGGALLATGGWIAVTSAFGAYLGAVASFGSIYGVFLTVVVTLAWCYFSALAFVAGIATDAELRVQNGKG